MSDTRLLRALRTLAPSLFPREPYLGPRRYRLIRMRPAIGSGDLTRAELQIVEKASGLPDKLLVEMWPGIAGALAKLTPGTYVLLQFVDGDPEQPYICAFAPADDPAWRPIDMIIDATNSVKVGPNASSVELAGSQTDVLTPGQELGRYVKYGDTIMFPSGSAATPTALPILGSAPGAVGSPAPPVIASRVK